LFRYTAFLPPLRTPCFVSAFLLLVFAGSAAVLDSAALHRSGSTAGFPRTCSPACCHLLRTCVSRFVYMNTCGCWSACHNLPLNRILVLRRRIPFCVLPGFPRFYRTPAVRVFVCGTCGRLPFVCRSFYQLFHLYRFSLPAVTYRFCLEFLCLLNSLVFHSGYQFWMGSLPWVSFWVSGHSFSGFSCHYAPYCCAFLPCWVFVWSLFLLGACISAATGCTDFCVSLPAFLEFSGLWVSVSGALGSTDFLLPFFRAPLFSLYVLFLPFCSRFSFLLFCVLLLEQVHLPFLPGWVLPAGSLYRF